MTQAVPDVIQATALNLAPYSNANRDEAGHPKSMEFLGTTRGRWSSQSVKAALRAAPHMGPLGRGVRSRNLSVETLERLLAVAEVPERVAFAAAEIVRSGLGNGDMRKPIEVAEALANALYRFDEDAAAGMLGVPPVAATRGKGGRGKAVAADPEPAPDEGEAALEDGDEKPLGRDAKAWVTKAAEKLVGGDKAYHGSDGHWANEWGHGANLVKGGQGMDSGLRKALVGVVQGAQPLLVSTQEIAWKERVEREVIEAAAKGAKALDQVLNAHGKGGRVASPMPVEAIDLDIALFGRMVASVPEATVDAAASFAHAMTVGEFAVEADFFTAREERPRDSRNDSVGHMGHAFWGAGIYLRYFALDMNLLRANLMIGSDGRQRSEAEAADLAERGASALIQAFATVLPRGKSTNSATFSPASYLLLERGAAPPTNLAVAFSRPVPLDAEDPMAESIARARSFKAAMTRAYGSGEVVEVVSHPGAEEVPGAAASLAEALGRIAR